MDLLKQRRYRCVPHKDVDATQAILARVLPSTIWVCEGSGSAAQDWCALSGSTVFFFREKMKELMQMMRTLTLGPHEAEACAQETASMVCTSPLWSTWNMRVLSLTRGA